MRNALSTLGVAITPVVTSVSIGGCVDPQGKLDEFAARVVDARDMSQDCPGFSEIPDVTGKFFFASRINQLDPIEGREPELFFELTLTFRRNPDKTGELDIIAKPLTFTDKKPVGQPIKTEAVPVDSCGRFAAPFE